MGKEYLLLETAVGYVLFEKLGSEEVAVDDYRIHATFQDYGKFTEYVKFVSYKPFTSPAEALANVNDISLSAVNATLKEFLDMNISGKAKSSSNLGVADEKLGAAIKDATGISAGRTRSTTELLRGCRMHVAKFIKGLTPENLLAAQVGLAHSYSRAKVKFNIHKVDNMIIQSIALVDQLEKDINTFSMRIREWYSYHFPELIKIVPDNLTYCRIVSIIKNKDSIKGNDEKINEKLNEVLMDETMVSDIVNASNRSIGSDISELDLVNIERFTSRVVALAEYKLKLGTYLKAKMDLVAPNLTALIGEIIGARLISHAGSLMNLAKNPASTIQILGAEKALFRALKSGGDTPKYGIIFNSPFIAKVTGKNKGRISRFLANKCALCARLDMFWQGPATNKFGEVMREQVEERIKFYKTGELPRKTEDILTEVYNDLLKQAEKSGDTGKKSEANALKSISPGELEDGDDESDEDMEDAEKPKKKKKKDKKEKKRKTEDEETPKKKSKKKNTKSAKKKKKKKSK